MLKRITIALLAMLMLAAMATTALAGKNDDPVEDPNQTPEPTAELLPVGDATDVRYIDGKLGVGTSNPAGKADVIGTLIADFIHSRGNLRMDGNDFVFGPSTRGDGGRAMVYDVNDGLTINYSDDFSGGVKVVGDLIVTGDYHTSSNDFVFNASTRGDGGRALVHDEDDTLTINYRNDFSGGVKVASNLSVSGYSDFSSNVNVGGTLITRGIVRMDNNDLTFGPSTRGDGGRAIVHDVNDALTINYSNDFAGGVKIASGLSVLGSGNFTGTVTTGSSRELKKNIAQLSGDEAIEALMSLMPVKYNYKTNSEELELGFIAEDVPDLVARNDRKSLSPMDFAALSVSVCQEQQKLIESLLERITTLEAAANRK